MPTESQKTEIVWEAHNARSNTSTGKKYFEETVSRAYEVSSSDIFAEPVPASPPANTTDVVKKHYPSGEGGDGLIEMTVDRSVGGNVSWVALPTHSNNWSSGSADTTQILRGFISPKHGAQYLVKVIDGNDNEIPQLDSSDWYFDYMAGVLTFNGVSSRPESGNTPADSIKIKVYQYVGKMVDEALQDAGDGGREIAHAELSGNKDGSNKGFLLPADADPSAHYIVYYNGTQLSEGADYSVDGENPRLLQLVEAPDSYDSLDANYYPVLAG